MAILNNREVLRLIYQQTVSDIAKKKLDSEDKDGDLRMLKAKKDHGEVSTV